VKTRLLPALALAAATAAAFSILLPAQPAQASCAADSGPAGAPVILSGTAVEERRGFTRFQVDEVWAGPDLAPEVWVRSGQRQPPWPFYLFSGVASSVDADFVIGEAYVVGAGASFDTSACSIAIPAEARDLRPPDPRSPEAGGAAGADPPAGAWLTWGGPAGVVLLAAAALVGWRRRRISRGAPPPPATAPPAPPAET
jgi:hypothetical protein